MVEECLSSAKFHRSFESPHSELIEVSNSAKPPAALTVRPWTITEDFCRHVLRCYIVPFKLAAITNSFLSNRCHARYFYSRHRPKHLEESSNEWE
jgi:hypothetical protein